MAELGAFNTGNKTPLDLLQSVIFEIFRIWSKGYAAVLENGPETANLSAHYMDAYSHAEGP